MPNTATPRIHLGPNPDAALTRESRGAAELSFRWTTRRPSCGRRGRTRSPGGCPDSVRWVQLPSAGVEPWISAGIVDSERVWTSAAGAYAGNVAEHGVLLLLAGVRALTEQVRATSWRKAEFDPQVGTLRGATVAIVGCGGIGRAMIPLLTAFGARVLAVTRPGTPVPGAVETLPVRSDVGNLVQSRSFRHRRAGDGGDRAHRRRGRARADGSRRRGSSTWRAAPSSTPRGSSTRCGPGRSAGPHSTSPIPNRCRTGIRCGPCRTPSSHRTSPIRRTGLTRATRRSRRANVERFAAGAPLLAPIDPRAGY